MTAPLEARALTFGVGRKASIPNGAGFLLIAQDTGKILLTLRAKRMREGGKWSTPGGILEHREAPMIAAVRETKEEIGLDLRDAEEFLLLNTIRSWTYRRFYDTFIVAVDRELELGEFCDETDDARWMTVEEALTLPLHSQLRPILKELA